MAENTANRNRQFPRHSCRQHRRQQPHLYYRRELELHRCLLYPDRSTSTTRWPTHSSGCHRHHLRTAWRRRSQWHRATNRLPLVLLLPLPLPEEQSGDLVQRLHCLPDSIRRDGTEQDRLEDQIDLYRLWSVSSYEFLFLSFFVPSIVLIHVLVD